MTDPNAPLGSEVNWNKAATFDRICEVTLTPNGKNVALRIGRSSGGGQGWEQVAFVLLAQGEVEALVERLRATQPEAPRHTPNGYDPRWVAAVNGVLGDRETGLVISDLDDDLWERFLGPMVDAIEDGHALVGLVAEEPDDE